jgi:hypothetical protein
MKHQKLLSKRRKNMAVKNEDPDHIDYDVEDITEFAASESARQALGKLVGKLSRWNKTEKIRIVIYFDEAHSLTRVKRGDEKSLYDHLCSCFNRFLASPISSFSYPRIRVLWSSQHLGPWQSQPAFGEVMQLLTHRSPKRLSIACPNSWSSPVSLQ